MKTQLKLSAVALALTAAFSAPAGATIWDTDSVGIGPLAAGATISCNVTSGCQTGFTTGSGWINLYGFSTPSGTFNSATPTTTGATPLTTAGTWVAAQLAIYSGGGIGISNTVQPSGADLATPQHAIDNSGVYDILVVDFGAGNTATNFQSLNMNYRCEIISTTACGGTGTVDVDAFVGNTMPTSFSGSGITGFTAVTFSTADPGPLATRVDTIGNPDEVGRYLVIAAGLNNAGLGVTHNGNSAFKINEIVATASPPPPPPPTSVPVPGSLPLLGLGLLALGFWRKRRT